MNVNDLKDSEYMGDGVYIGHDGYQVWLITSNGFTTTNAVALEDGTLNNVIKYINKLRETKNV